MESVTQKPAGGLMGGSGLVFEACSIAGGINILHKFEKVFTADMGLLCIGQKAFQCGGDEICAVDGTELKCVAQACILSGGAAEGYGFLLHDALIVADGLC